MLNAVPIKGKSIKGGFEMKKSKMVALTLAAAMCVGLLAGCGGGGSSSGGSASGGGAAAQVMAVR